MQLTAAPTTQAAYSTYSQKKQTNPTIISWQSVPPLFQRRCFEWKADVEKCPSLFVLNLWFKGLMLDRLYAVKRPLDYRKRSLDGKVLKSIQKLLTTRCFLLRDTEQFSLVGLLLFCLASPSGFFTTSFYYLFNIAAILFFQRWMTYSGFWRFDKTIFGFWIFGYLVFEGLTRQYLYLYFNLYSYLYL